jgi:hypothetical protein
VLWLTPVILAVQEDHGLKPAWAKSSGDPISKKPLQSSKCVRPSLNPNPSTTKKKKTKRNCTPEVMASDLKKNYVHDSTFCLFHFLGGGWVGGWNWGVNLGFHTCKASTLLLQPPSRSFGCGCTGDGDLSSYLPVLASNLNPPNLSLPSS